MAFRALNSLSSDSSPKTRTVAIAMKAHSVYKIDPFIYAMNNLVPQKLCIIVCLSRLDDEVGMYHRVAVESFTVVHMKKLEAAVKTQIACVNHFLRALRDNLDQRGVQLEIRVSTGPKSFDILVQAAKALHPHWLVLDRSFSSNKKKIQAALKCNLVLMKKKGMPETLQVSPGDLVEDIGDEEELEPSSYPRTTSRTPISSSKASPITRQSFLRSQNPSTQEATPQKEAKP